MTDVSTEVAQPEDHKPAAPGPFTWTAEDGRTATFKPFNKLPVGLFRKSRQMNELEGTFALLEAGTDEDGLAVLDDQPIDKLEEIFTAWTAASGVDSPEA